MAQSLSLTEPLQESDIAPANRQRFTLDGDEAVEARIQADQDLIGQAVVDATEVDQFRALVLMGGYGRGEGGFQQLPDGPAPYNDYDYFVVLDGLSRAQRAQQQERLQPLAHQLEAKVGIDVDFFVLRNEELARAEYSLMNAEMLWGHRVVAGDTQVLQAMPSMPITSLPLSEFSRLMLNRGSLLVMNQASLAQAAPLSALERERFVKYLFKAVLASVDAVLAAVKHYHPSYPQKLDFLQQLAALSSQAQWPVELANALMPHYEQALEARFHPDYSQHIEQDLESWQQQITGLWLQSFGFLERRRLGRDWGDWAAYAEAGLDKGQSGLGLRALLKNLAVNARDYGLAAVFADPSRAMRYPRERLLAALPLLLSEPLDGDRIAAILSLPSDDQDDPARLAEGYIRQWHRYA